MDDDLKKLSQLTAPPASPDAKARALARALETFDAEKNIATATQGSSRPVRQSSIINQIWSAFMNRQLLAGSALATLMLLPAAGFLSVRYMQEHPVSLPVAENEIALQQPSVLKQETPVNAPAANTLAEAPNALGDNKVVPTPILEQPAPMVEQSQDKGTQNKGTLAKAAPEPADEAIALAPLPAAPVMSNPESLASKPMPKLMGSASVMRQKSAVGDIEAPVLTEADQNRFSDNANNPVKAVATDPVSTFSVDVDTASYSFVRRDLMSGVLPGKDEVRVEEMINYFPYSWPQPDTIETPFKATVTVTPTPWNTHTKLMHIGIKGFDIAQPQRPKANLVFLIDVSGSMDEETKLPLLKSAFRLLVDTLKPDDTVSIVTYAGDSGVVLEPTKISDKAAILHAIDTLSPGGSTAGAAGLQTAYELAEKSFVKDGVNRVMLATDGDFNVGQTSDDDLKHLIEAKRKSGVFLSVLGFGHDNYNDQMMQVLAQNGNGTAAFIDTLAEAQKTLVEESGGSLFPIAKDVKIQVEFNPQQIAEYRLIGYETRAMNREDFNNDKVDAGDIGSGHRVTAIYEVTPVGSPAVLNDPLRYEAGKTAPQTAVPTAKLAETAGELAFVKMRYKAPEGTDSKLITTPVTQANAIDNLDKAPDDVRFSIAVAAFGQKLRDTTALDSFGYQSILDLGTGAKGADPFGYRAEFLKLVQLAKSLSSEP